MKVLMIAANYPPEPCGMADYTKKLCQSLYYLTEFKPTVLTTLRSKIKIPPASDEKIPVMQVMEKWSKTERFRLMKVVKSERPRVVHIQYHDGDFPETALVCALPRLVKKYDPSIGVVVSLANFDLEDPAVLKMIDHADILTVTADEDMARLVKHEPLLKKRTMLAYDAPNITMNKDVSPDVREIRRRLGLDVGGKLLVFFGFPNPGKGIEELFRALAILHEKGYPARLLMLGGEAHSGQENRSYVYILRKLVEKLGLKQAVSWSGYASEKDVTMCLRSADIAVMPFKEGISGRRSSFWSVLDHGIPVVTTRAPKIPEGLVDGENVVFAERCDPQLIAEAIIPLYESDVLCSKIGAGGQDLVQARYSWARLCQEIFTAYKKALAL